VVTSSVVLLNLTLTRTLTQTLTLNLCRSQARDTPANAPAVRELDLDLSLWQPLIVDRQFVAWLVKEPTEQVRLPATAQSFLNPLDSCAPASPA